MTITLFQRARIVDPSRGIDETGTVIVFLKHRANIARLAAGTESRIGR